MPDPMRLHFGGAYCSALLCLPTASLLMGCASPGAAHTPLAPLSAAAVGLERSPTGEADTLPSAHWWSALGDPQLNALLEEALAQQPSLAVARAREAQASALANARHALNGPQASLSIDTARQRYTANGLVPPPVAGNVYDSANLQAGVSWSPDFFGLHQAERDAAIGQARAARADAAAAANTLATRIARHWVGLARVLADQNVASQALEQRQAIGRLTRERVDAGLDSEVERTQADAAVPQAASQVEAMAEQATLARRQLAVLAGRAPDSLSHLNPQLFALTLPPVPPVLGADLLGRRPDVVAARWRVEAATQGVSAAHSEFYPNISLSALVGLNALGLNRLFQAGSLQAGVAPALRLPLFDAGRLRAQLRGREAELDGAVAQYNVAVLEAVKQAGDAMASVDSIARQQSLQQAAHAGSEKAWQFARERYRAGLGNYLIVLNTETHVLAQRQKTVALQARALVVRVELMSALGGGWTDDTAPFPPHAH